MEAAELSFMGFSAIVVTLGLVQFIKEGAGIDGWWVSVLALVIGGLFSALFYAISQDLITGDAVKWIGVAVMGLVGGLTAAGYYKLGNHYSGQGG